MSVILQSSDNVKFLVDVNIAQCIGLIKTMLDTKIYERNDTPIRLHNVDSVIIRKVLTWITYHKDIPHAGEDDKPFYISGWDVEFLEVDCDTLYKLILAADYLDVRGLLDLICKTVGYMFNRLTPDDIMSLFNIKKNSIKETKYD